MIYIFCGFVVVVFIAISVFFLAIGIQSAFNLMDSCYDFRDYAIQLLKIIFVIVFFSLLFGGIMYIDGMENKNKTEVIE